MNAGLTNLDTLKKYLLADTLAGQTRFDQVIQTIGLGVAGLFDTFCNRKFAWQTGDVITFSGDRPHYYLSRFPIAKIGSIKMRYFQTDQWTAIDGQPITLNFETGLVHFGYTLGRFPLQVQITWDGGYWFETLEPDDAAYPSSAPAVSDIDPNAPPASKYLLPDSLRSAFLMQCEAIWAARDKLGAGVIDKPNEQSKPAELTPIVKTILQPFIRYQLS